MNTSMDSTESNQDLILKAKLEVQESDAQVEKALENLKGQVGDGLEKFKQYKEAVKDPILLSATAFIIGTYLGQMIRHSSIFRK